MSKSWFVLRPAVQATAAPEELAVHSLELFKSALSTSETIANEEPILKQQWEDAMKAQPAEFQQRVMRDALAARAGGGGAPPECVIA